MDYIWLEMTDKQRKLYFEKEQVDTKRFDDELKEYKSLGHVYTEDISEAETQVEIQENDTQEEVSDPKDYEMEDFDQEYYQLQQFLESRKNSNPPKKPLSCYFIFSQHYGKLDSTQNARKDMHFTDFNKLTGVKWQGMSVE